MRRSIRIGNCSGAMSDQGIQMYRQATQGPIDAITGDYLAEINIASNALAKIAGTHPGWEPTCESGLEQSLEVIVEKKIKVVVNGGALNPQGLAIKVTEMAKKKNLTVKVAYVSGDDLMDRVDELINSFKLVHLDSSNTNVKYVKNTDSFIQDPNRKVVSVNAYLGARAIRQGLEEGADIIITGRVADASPVIGLCAWWHDWKETDFDALAGALVAGHLIECSAYITGCNFCDFERYDINKIIDVGYPIAEVSSDGSCILTKHEGTNGIINVDTVICQLLYELQGNIYLNSDVKADLTNIVVESAGENRVSVHGAKGYAPPPTTKLAVFYQGGFQAEATFNATGINSSAKFKFMEAQWRHEIEKRGISDKIDILEFQKYAPPEVNPVLLQERGTAYMRVFIQAKEAQTIGQLLNIFMMYGMQHYSGMHCTNDMRTMTPKIFLAYYPALIAQTELNEEIVLLDADGNESKRVSAGHASVTESMQPRDNYETENPVDLKKFGETEVRPLGDVILARSGDKGGNVNVGFFVHKDDEYEWLQTLLTKEYLKTLIGDSWRDEYYIERVEMPHLKAVHFVVYGILSRGVSSSPLLDSLGKGFADYLRSKHVDIPIEFLSRYDCVKY